MTGSPRATTGMQLGPLWRDHAIGAVLCIAYVAVLLATAPDIGMSRDESIYVGAAKAYASWFEVLIEDPDRALARDAIDRVWRVNSEHPPLAKSLFALSYLLDRELSLFTRVSLAHRFPGMLSAGLLLWLIHIFGTRLWGRRVGLFAALAFALLPRPFYHAHLNAFDVPITLALTLVTYAYVRALHVRSWKNPWALATGLLYGLALATKHNSWGLPGIFAIHFSLVLVLARMYRARATSPVDEAARPVSAFPYWLLAMITIGPVLFVGSWPWLWHETLQRIGRYAAFHLNHDFYNIAYFGVNYFWPPFPVSYPWVLTLFTVPITTLCLSLFGLWLRGSAVVSDVRATLRGAPAHDPRLIDILMFGCTLAPLLIIALPWTPIFGGTKHWFPSYPFLVLLSGVAFERVRAACAARIQNAVAARALPFALGLYMLAPAALETAHSHPFGLSHYGMGAGFVPGSADHGMNRQFWGFTTGSLVSFFNANVPDGSRVYVCDTTIGAFRMLAEDGLISSGILPTLDLAQSDFALVHHEHHMAEVDFQIWAAYGTTKPVHVLAYDGVPIISVYKHPK
jgi:4-amino-4-deoxy-L-arabinose transferase-like glycosyltransferase